MRITALDLLITFYFFQDAPPIPTFLFLPHLWSSIINYCTDVRQHELYLWNIRIYCRARNMSFTKLLLCYLFKWGTLNENIFENTEPFLNSDAPALPLDSFTTNLNTASLFFDIVGPEKFFTISSHHLYQLQRILFQLLRTHTKFLKIRTFHLTIGALCGEFLKEKSQQNWKELNRYLKRKL